MKIDKILKYYMVFYVILAVLFAVSCMMTLHILLEEVEDKGLKGIVEEVWEGPEKE